MSARQTHVLVVDDEPAQLEVLVYNLEREGYAVSRAVNGEDALLQVEELAPDLVILDWMMPLVSGIEVCRQLKTRAETREIPVIMLSAKTEEVDMVRGLETGADDYIFKPYSMLTVIARVRALLRRARPSLSGEKLVHNDIALDPERHLVTRGETELKLGPTEYRLLLTLLEKPGRVFTRDQLLDIVWRRDIYVDTRTVDVHIARLRKALAKREGDDPIRTVRGTGYSLA